MQKVPFFIFLMFATGAYAPAQEAQSPRADDPATLAQHLNVVRAEFVRNELIAGIRAENAAYLRELVDLALEIEAHTETAGPTDDPIEGLAFSGIQTSVLTAIAMKDALPYNDEDLLSAYPTQQLADIYDEVVSTRRAMPDTLPELRGQLRSSAEDMLEFLDALKIDVERSELGVSSGIGSASLVLDTGTQNVVVLSDELGGFLAQALGADRLFDLSIGGTVAHRKTVTFSMVKGELSYQGIRCGVRAYDRTSEWPDYYPPTTPSISVQCRYGDYYEGEVPEWRDGEISFINAEDGSLSKSSASLSSLYPRKLGDSGSPGRLPETLVRLRLIPATTGASTR